MLKRYLPLFLIITFFSYFALPLIFLNNDYFNMLFSFHIDSGSIISSVFEMLKKENYYNQNAGYHTAYYGFPYNSILFFIFEIIRNFGFDILINFNLFSISARLFTFITAIFALILNYILNITLFKNTLFSFLINCLLIIFPGFFNYVYLIKPDILSLCFCISSFYFMFKFLKQKKDNYYILTLISIFLSFFNKQPYIFLLIPGILCYFLNKSFNIKNIKRFTLLNIKSTFVILILTFIIHPYLFINLPIFIQRQKELRLMVSSPIDENITNWLMILNKNYFFLIGFISSLITLIIYKFKKRKSTSFKLIFLMSVFSLIYIVWLILFVGPFRVLAYLIPVYNFFVINIFFIFKLLYEIKKINKLKLILFSKIFFSFLIFFLLLFSIKYMLQDLSNSINGVKNFKNSIQVKVVNQVLSNPILKKPYKITKIAFTASIPIPSEKFKNSVVLWQFGQKENKIKGLKNFQPDIIIVDTTQFYEDSYYWWEKNIKKIGFFNKKNYFNNKIVVFYKIN